jgi:hypothetical protein
MPNFRIVAAILSTMVTRRFVGVAFVVVGLFTVLVLGLQKYRTNSSSAARQKLAEGAYAMESTSDHLKIDIDSFNLWSGPDQHLRAEIEIPAPGIPARDKTKAHRQTEMLEMNSDFRMRRFRYELENSTVSGDGALDCSVHYGSLECESTFEGSSGKGSIDVSGGYAVQFGAEIALLDDPWFFTTLVAHGSRDTKQQGTMEAVGISFDGQTPETLITGRPTHANLNYAGIDTITVVGHSVKAHRFQVSGGGSRDMPDLTSTVWVSERGLLLAADWGDVRIELSRFLQREQLIPELPVEDDQAVAIRHSEQFQGQQYMRIQSAVWVDGDSPDESVYHTLQRLGLVDIEESDRGTVQGKRFLIVKLTEAGKTATTKWKEGATAWDIPIAQERIAEIRPKQQWQKPVPSAIYIVSYRWEPNEIGNQLKENLPAKWAISTDTITAKVFLQYARNEWKVIRVERPSEEALKRH